MNFAKKAMSLALASVMAASSLFVGSTAFAADKVITPMKSNTQAVTPTIKDTVDKNGYHNYEVDSSLYSYTPAQTGYYAVSLKSTPVYENGNSQYSYAYSNEYSDRVDWANVGVYENSSLSSSSSLADIETTTNALSYVQKDASSYPVADKEEYIDGYDVVRLTAGKTYYFDVNASTYSNPVASSKTDERTFFTGGTLSIVPTEWDYSLVSTKTGTQKFTVVHNGYNETVSENLYKLTVDTKYVGTATAVTTVDKINNLPVTALTGTQNKEIKSLTLSSNIKSVEGMNNLRNLTSVNLGSVETIENSAFANDTALTSISIPASVKKIDEFAFSGCSALSSVSFMNGVKQIGEKAFYETALKSVVLPTSVTEIDNYAFGYVTGFDTNTVDPYDTTEVAKAGFVMAGYSCDAAAKYAALNDFAYYDMTKGCPHPYNVTTVAATVFASGKKTSVCPICGNTTTQTIKKKTFKISSVKSSKKRTIVVKAPKQTGMTGYQVQYSTSKKFTKKATKTSKVATKKALNKTVKSLKSGKKYYVRVRAYKTSNGKTVYSSWTATKSVKVK